MYNATLSKQTELEAALSKVESELQEALDTKKALEEQKWVYRSSRQVILSLLLIQEKQLSVSGERICTNTG